MGLIRKARITIPPLVHEHLGVIDDRHVVRHCKPKQPEQQQPEQEQEAGPSHHAQSSHPSHHAGPSFDPT
ncbi:hypothetical protein A2U01_0072723, partial [Trifolium medium]|nr:hypothetical protein [Trifolium medium]